MKPAKAPVCVRCQIRELECQLETTAHIVWMADHDLGLCYEYAAPDAIAEAEGEYRKAFNRYGQLDRQLKRLRARRALAAACVGHCEALQ